MALSTSVFGELNVWAILVAAAAYFALGSLWYSPLMFARTWTDLIGRKMDEMGDPKVAIAINAIADLLVAAGLAVLIHAGGYHHWVDGLGVGALIGVAFIVPVLLNSVAFEGRSPSLFFLNAAYQVIGYCIMGAILGAWW